MRVPGRGVRPESPLAGGGYCYGGGWSGAKGNAWESSCGLSLMHPSDVAAAARSAPVGWETEAHHQIRVRVKGRASGRVQQPRVQPAGMVVLLGLSLREHHAPRSEEAEGHSVRDDYGYYIPIPFPCPPPGPGFARSEIPLTALCRWVAISLSPNFSLK